MRFHTPQGSIVVVRVSESENECDMVTVEGSTSILLVKYTKGFHKHVRSLFSVEALGHERQHVVVLHKAFSVGI